MHYKKIGIVTLGFHFSSLLYAGDINGNDNVALWIGLMALAMVSFLILFISSKQSRKLQALHQSLFDRCQVSPRSTIAKAIS